MTVVVVGLIYLAYFAPFLKIQSLSVQGADATLTSQIQGAFHADLSRYVHGLPERNILFFPKSRFASEISSNGLVSKVSDVHKVYWHGVSITVVQRVPAFVLQTPNSSYVISNDGIASAVLASGDPLPAGLPVIADAANDDPSIGTLVLSPQKIAYIQTVASALPGVAQTSVQSYQVSSIDSDFITFVTQAGYHVLFDATSDASADLSHLKQIIATQGSSGHTAYIDMRFNPRVYVCAIGQPCATTAPSVTPQP